MTRRRPRDRARPHPRASMPRRCGQVHPSDRIGRSPTRSPPVNPHLSTACSARAAWPSEASIEATNAAVEDGRSGCAIDADQAPGSANQTAYARPRSQPAPVTHAMRSSRSRPTARSRRADPLDHLVMLRFVERLKFRLQGDVDDGGGGTLDGEVHGPLRRLHCLCRQRGQAAR